jgi:hypothetical protein
MKPKAAGAAVRRNVRVEEAMNWGRQGAAPAMAMPIRRASYGRRSVMLAFAALATVLITVGALIAVPSGSPEPLSTIMTFATAAVYLVVAPLLHIAGAVYGIASLSREGDRKVLGVVGFLLNVMLLGAGAWLGWIAVGSMGAFT